MWNQNNLTMLIVSLSDSVFWNGLFVENRESIFKHLGNLHTEIAQIISFVLWAYSKAIKPQSFRLE